LRRQPIAGQADQGAQAAGSLAEQFTALTVEAQGEESIDYPYECTLLLLLNQFGH
jgi:hypothetical protein